MPQSREARLTLERLASVYIAHAVEFYRRADGEPTGEHRNIASSLVSLMATVPGSLPIADLTADHLTAWTTRLAGEKKVRRSINQQLGRVKRMLRWAVESKLVSHAAIADAMSAPTLRMYRSSAPEGIARQIPSLQDVWRVAGAMPPAEAAVLKVLALTGARIGEVTGLRSDELQLDAGLIAKGQHKCAWRGSTRTIPVVGQLVAILAERQGAAEGGYLFPGRFKGSITTGHIRKAIYAACESLGLARFTPHAVRHAVARAARKHHGLAATSKLLGHSSTRMTEVYAPSVDDGAVAAATSIGELLRTG